MGFVPHVQVRVRIPERVFTHLIASESDADDRGRGHLGHPPCRPRAETHPAEESGCRVGGLDRNCAYFVNFFCGLVVYFVSLLIIDLYKVIE